MAFSNLMWAGTTYLSMEHWVLTDFIFYEIRLPKMITAILAGSALAISGQLMQVVFRNPLAGPYVLGISSGSSLAVAIVILITGSMGLISISAAAIVGALGVTLLVLSVASKISSNVVILIVGLMLAQIFSSFETALQYFANPSSLKQFVLWGMGSLGNVSIDQLKFYAFTIIAVLMSTVFIVKPMNALLLGPSYAASSGIAFKSARFWIIFISSLLTGLATALCGPIAFIGIAVPVISRQLLQDSRQQLHLPINMLLGSIILLSSDILCHQLLSDSPLPLNMVTSLIGAPVVIWLMFKNKQW